MKKIVKFSNTLDKILKSHGWTAKLHEYRILSQWEAAVGTTIAYHARPKTLIAGKLLVIVDSGVWMQQLSMMKPEILQKLNSMAGVDAKIKDISLKIGVVEPPTRAASDDAEMPDIPLSAEERGRIQEYLASIDDPELGSVIERVIERDMAYKKRREGK